MNESTLSTNTIKGDVMELHEFNRDVQVYYSAQDRFVKKINDDIYEVYHINVITNGSFLVVYTINFKELNDQKIQKYLDSCGLIFKSNEKKLVQKYDQNEVIIEDTELFPFVLADRLSLVGAQSNMDKFIFEDADDLNEVLLEHNILHRFSNATLQSL